MARIEKISNIQNRIMKQYQQLKEKGLVKESEPKEKMINKIANYMLAHSNISDNNLDKELGNVSFKSVHKQVCMDAVQIYGNQVKQNISEGQGVYFWVPEAEKNAHGFKISKSLPAVILLKSIIRELAEYVYDSLSVRQQEALELKDLTTSLAEDDIFQSRHIPYFINESVYFRRVNKAEGAERKRLKNRAEKALVLIWNGFGAEKLDWYHDQIFSLLTVREENNRPIIFTSDWNFDVFANLDYQTNAAKLKKKGGRIASRVAGMTQQMIFKLEAETNN